MDLLKDEDKIKEIYKPTCAFITFTNQEAKERAVQYLCKENKFGKIN